MQLIESSHDAVCHVHECASHPTPWPGALQVFLWVDLRLSTSNSNAWSLDASKEWQPRGIRRAIHLIVLPVFSHRVLLIYPSRVCAAIGSSRRFLHVETDSIGGARRAIRSWLRKGRLPPGEMLSVRWLRIGRRFGGRSYRGRGLL